jgi:hypothetical protein
MKQPTEGVNQFGDVEFMVEFVTRRIFMSKFRQYDILTIYDILTKFGKLAHLPSGSPPPWHARVQRSVPFFGPRSVTRLGCRCDPKEECRLRRRRRLGPDTSLYTVYCILRGSDRFRFVQICVHIKATVSALSVHRRNFREIYQL